SDGNLWFTEGAVPTIGRITPAGAITEFGPVCASCLPNDIVQGPTGILYFTSNDPAIGRITTAGVVLTAVPMPNTNANGNGLTAHGGDVWTTDFNGNNIWRYEVATGTFTRFAIPTAGANPYDVAVDDGGTVWFTEANANAIGRLDQATG